jgi:hypothetical protein
MKLEEARNANDGQLLSDLVYDADCEDLNKEIDLTWYEQKAANLLQENDL